MKSILSLLKASIADSHFMKPTERFSANANQQKQMRFYKTRKSNPRLTSRWAKPTQEERGICAELLSQQITVCGVCHKEDETINRGGKCRV